MLHFFAIYPQIAGDPRLVRRSHDNEECGEDEDRRPSGVQFDRAELRPLNRGLDLLVVLIHRNRRLTVTESKGCRHAGQRTE
jgi:hypothetical protein